MRRSDDFGTVVRRGTRARRGPVVVYYRAGLRSANDPAPALIGLVVGRGVGGSVVRHRVSRRLRAQLAVRLDALPSGSGTVVRALPEAAAAHSAELGDAVAAALRRLTGAERVMSR
jgi:ribonuclease P protein component